MHFVTRYMYYIMIFYHHHHHNHLSLDLHLAGLHTQAVDVVQDLAGSVVALAGAGDGHAGGGDVALVLRWIKLPTELTVHRQIKDRLRLLSAVLKSHSTQEEGSS